MAIPLRLKICAEIYGQTLKTQRLDSSFNLCFKKEGKTIILVVC